MTNPQKALKDIAGLTISAGIAYASGFLPESFISGIIREVSNSLTTDYIKKADYQKIKGLLTDIHPSEFNHDLQKLIIKSIEWSIKIIEMLYIENNKLSKTDYRTDRLKKINKSLIRQVNGAVFSQQAQALHIKVENINGAKEFFECLNIDVGGLHDVKTNNPYGAFFKERFPKMLKLCFGELLKKEENRKALIDYEQEVKQTINNKLDKILDELENSNINKTSGFNVLTVQEVRHKFNSSRLDYFMDTIREQYITIANDLEYLKNAFEQILQELQGNYFEKKKVYIFSTVIAFVVIVFGLIYYIITLPFTTNITLEPNKKIKVHNEYPPLSYGDKPKIVFYLNQKNPRDIIENEATFPKIDYKYKDRKIRVELIDDYWKLSQDSLMLNSGSLSLQIEPNEKLSTISGRVFKHVGHEPIRYAQIKLVDEGIDTIVDSNGLFKIKVPIEFRREKYNIQVVLNDSTISNWTIHPGNVKPIPINIAKD
ncbi:hypothetical protein [Flavivirga eckloniae]|uniref:Uncharacterized protein n=1 Tax=Flavivirga eckloniae TaxID=1803846 RepID=A0A2K9PXF4_9FLAO|nr:hypothetical protein [Flavivirga eckloniae]AUP81227.1 hypothetical protein C1H87_21920 [Flavivirga eckloniae]